MSDLGGSLAATHSSTFDVPDEPSPFRTLLSEFIYVRTYSRWVDELGRRETWPETVDRYMRYLETERPNVPRDVLEQTRRAVLALEVLPSMRALWSAGEAARRDNTCMYNCSFIPLDSIPSFAEALHILMCGTGVGFSVERKFVDNFPVVATLTDEVVPYRIADSTEGWADALKFGLTQWFKGNQVAFDYSGLRARGTPLRTKGGRASGPEPLQRLLDLCQVVILAASGRKLRPIECHDIACAIGDIVHVGGFRRAALISFSDPDDEEMRHAKDWSRGEFPAIRYMSNNSAFYEQRPDEEAFWQEWRALVASRSGERGFFRMPPAKRATRRGDYRTNPCGEIGLRFTTSVDPWTGEGGSGSFCNLTAAVMRADDTRETMAEKVRLATWLGIIQATFTDFPYLRKGWAKICDEDRLLGVDITGQCDNPALSDDVDTMTYFNRVARETAAEAAAVMGINMPAAITCGKPSGNSSQLVDCSSGFHPRYARYYFRRVRIDGKDPLTALLRDSGVPMYKENGMGHLPDDEVPVWVVQFPVKAPEGAMVRDSETAVQMCDRYLRVMRSWCGERGHNQSATIYVRDHEWDEVGRWVFEHFDEITGLAFLPHDGGSYKLAPYEEITEEQYLEAVAQMPEVDFSLLAAYEQDDRGKGATELACMSGSCEL
jgi:ribonucleoside-diphosphate reductase alpha chain